MADYYYTRQGKVRGPIPLEQIVKHVKARKLPQDTQVCAVGKKEWKSVQSVAPDVANLASNAKIVGWTIGGAAGLILLLMGVMWLFRADKPKPEGEVSKAGEVAKKPGGTSGAEEEEPDEKIVTEFTVTPGKTRLEDVMLEGEKKRVLIMDVELQSPTPVQIPLTQENLYVNGTGKRVQEKSETYYIAPRQADYEMNSESDPKNLAMGSSSLVGFDEGELILKLEGVKKYRISLMFFDPPGENVVLHFPPSQPWSGTTTVASVDEGLRPAGGDAGAGNFEEPEMGTSGGGKKKETETIVVGNVPEDFAFMPLSKVKDGDIADIKEVLAAVADMKIDFKVDTPEEAQVALVSGDDVVTGLHGEGLRLFPIEAGAEVKMWITEPFAAYRKGTLIAVYDPTKEKFRRPNDDDGVPPTITTPAGGAPAGEAAPAAPVVPAEEGTMAPDAAGAGKMEGEAPKKEGGPAMAPEMMDAAP